MSYFNLAESAAVWIGVAVIMTLVMVLAAIFIKKSWARAIELGYSSAQLNNIVKSTVSFSLVPSIAILIGFFGLATMVGVPWAYYRLSVIGSVSYEVMAADSALKAVGVELGSATARDFSLVMLVMSICIVGGLVTATLFAKNIQAGTLKMKDGDARWGALGGSTFMMTIMAVFIVPMLLKGGVTLLTLLTSAAITLVLGLVIKKTGSRWLTNFVLAIALLVAMGSSVLWTSLLK